MITVSIKRDSVNSFRKVLLEYEKSTRFSLRRVVPEQLANNLNNAVRQTLREDWYGKGPSSGYGLSGGRLRGAGEDNITLERSFQSSFRVEGNTVVISSKSDRPYAAIHATGDTILPSKQFLAIPLPRAMAYFGSIDKKARVMQYVASVGGPALLVKKVTIKPKPIGSSKNYLELAAERATPTVATTVTGRLQNIWNKLTGRFR